ncbi:MAG: hypothetical protein IM509_05470 [Microcystis sp. M31BS1]|uniref:hypothetical protein n=1 Tax=Microcystis sp. M31BS1 TaxID=2771186 RepID=UPI00258E4AAB|nr:hypothetical protein [Microcystis sp. M31BS1]MCA2590200.1 hypothetical protein [Microcystis sp. M31BS1]
MQPLVDSDVLLYEIGFSSQREEDGVIVPSSWEFTQDLFDKKIALICDEVGATQPPLLFLTNTPRINKLLNRERKRQNKPPVEHVDNFRNEIAKEKVYKGTRKADKPFHFYNLLAYVLASYQTRIHEGGLEADDFMCIEQFSRLDTRDTVICSRDKDVRQCPGLHYSWECGKQPSIGPIYVEPLGFLEKKEDGKIWGVGHKFFYYQLIVGDTVDNIGGIKGKGPAFAFKLIHDLETERQCYEHVAELYIKAHGDDWKEKLLEQARLLHMVRELNEDHSPKMWLPPRKDKE